MSIASAFGQSAQLSSQKVQRKEVLSALKIDSISVLRRQQRKVDSLSQLASNTVGKSQEMLNSFEERIMDKQEAARSKVDSLFGKVHDKLPINPTLNQSSIVSDKLEGINRNTEKLYAAGPKVEELKENVGELNLGGVEKLEQPQAVKEAQLSTGLAPRESFGALSKAKKYTEGVVALKEGNLDKIGVEEVLEQKVQSLAGVSALEAKKATVAPQLEGYKNMPDPFSPSESLVAPARQHAGGDSEALKNWNQRIPSVEKLKDGDALKPARLRHSGGKETANHIKVLAADYFTQQVGLSEQAWADKLKAAQDKLSKWKKKFGGLASINDIPARTGRGGNPLKGKTFGERLIIGGNFQIYKGKPFGLDISPQLAYKLTPKFRMGVGGVFRTSFGNNDIDLTTPNQPTGQTGKPVRSHGRERSAYGFSGYLAHDVYKRFYAHGEFEKLHTRPQQAPDEKTKQPGNLHESAYLGIGKTYHISNMVKGNIMLLYDVLNDKTNPYRRPWNIRFGFQLVKDKRDKE